MTRINVVPVTELCDQHLLAEHRELTRIPNTIHAGKAKVDILNIPTDYVLGEGHVKFFYDKLGFLLKRYKALYEECLARGFNVQYIWPSQVEAGHARYKFLFKDYVPTENALLINRERIFIRMPTKARFTPKAVV